MAVVDEEHSCGGCSQTLDIAFWEISHPLCPYGGGLSWTGACCLHQPGFRSLTPRSGGSSCAFLSCCSRKEHSLPSVGHQGPRALEWEEPYLPAWSRLSFRGITQAPFVGPRSSFSPLWDSTTEPLISCLCPTAQLTSRQGPSLCHRSRASCSGPAASLDARIMVTRGQHAQSRC